MTVDIKPLEKIVVNGTDIELGASRKIVESILGSGISMPGRKNEVYYFNDEMRIDYDADNKVEFIEFLYGIDGDIQPTLDGKAVFQLGADELYELLSDKNNGDIDDSEAGYAYRFLNISVGVYREITPEDVQEMIEESANEGEAMSQEDIAEEMKRANYWATFGLGIKGYYE